MYCKRDVLTRKGSNTSAADGRKSELSEWQRSIADEGLSKPRKISGTATGNLPRPKKVSTGRFFASLCSAVLFDSLG